MNLPLLYNLNTGRSTQYTETITVGVDGTAYLTHIPLKDSLTVTGYNIVSFREYDSVPTLDATQVALNWGDEYNYIISTGLLYFNVSEAGKEVVVAYIPAASRIDAEILNQIIVFANTYDGNIYTKAELAAPSTAQIHWSNLTFAPGVASEDAEGFLSAADKQKLNIIDGTKTPIGGINSGGTVISPDTWGGNVTIEETSTIIPSTDGGNIRLDVNPSAFTSLSTSIVQALSGTSGSPGNTNRYVTSSDARLSDSRTPVPHVHSESDITGLVAALAAASVGLAREIIIADIVDFTDHANIPTTDEKGALVGIGGDPSASNPYVTNLDSRMTNARMPLFHVHSETDITGLQGDLLNRALIGHRHTHSDISDWTNSTVDVAPYLRTSLLYDDFVVSGLTSVISSTLVYTYYGTPGSQWYQNQAYAHNALLVVNSGLYSCSIGGTSGSSTPTWLTTSNTIDGGVTWAYIGAVNSWSALTYYALGTYVSGGAYVYSVTTAGFSGPTPPTWASSGTVNDTGAFCSRIIAGSAYIGGNYTALPNTDYNYIGYFQPTGTAGRYPIISQYVTNNEARTYTITITKANTVPGILSDLEYKWKWTTDFLTWQCVDTNIVPWTASYSYSGGQYVVKSGRLYTASAGISGESEPSWGGATVVDGTVTWNRGVTCTPYSFDTDYAIGNHVAFGTAYFICTVAGHSGPNEPEWVLSSNAITLDSFRVYPRLRGLDNGLREDFYTNGSTTQYQVGDSWTFNTSKSCDTYVDITSIGTLTYKFVTTSASAPALDSGSLRVLKMVTNGTGISSITDLRQILKIARVNQIHADNIFGTLGASNSKGVAANVAALPASSNTPGDFYLVLDDGTGSQAIFSWTGSVWRNLTNPGMSSILSSIIFGG